MNGDGYWVPTLIYYKGHHEPTEAVKPIESGGGGVFDGAGASARHSGMGDVLGVAIIVAMLVRQIRRTR